MVKIKFEGIPELSFRGNQGIINNTKRAAIVGQRAASDVELTIASRIGATLAGIEYTVVSGFAKGIDQAGQLGALQAGGNSISVLPTGLGNRYPVPYQFRQYLKENLLEVSQYPDDYRFTGQRAMQRNKVISGLSQAVFVVGSGTGRDGNGRGSGTFQGVLMALQQGKNVYVVAPEVYEASGITAPPGNKILIERGAKVISHSSEIPGVFE